MENVRLIACDMDRTLLTDDKQFPPNFWETVEELAELGVHFVPASGRPLITLKEMFVHPGLQLDYISDNGALVELEGEILHRAVMDRDGYLPIIAATLDKTDGVPVLCGIDCAYVLEDAREHEDALHVYYKSIVYVDDLADVDVPIIKYSVLFVDLDAREAYDDVFEPMFGSDFAVTLGGPEWVDVMNAGVTKGAGIKALSQALSLSTDEMMAFGDAFNDLEMLDAVDHSYAVANAEPEIIERAKYITGTNEEYGVMDVLRQLIARRRNAQPGNQPQSE